MIRPSWGAAALAMLALPAAWSQDSPRTDGYEEAARKQAADQASQFQLLDAMAREHQARRADQAASAGPVTRPRRDQAGPTPSPHGPLTRPRRSWPTRPRAPPNQRPARRRGRPPVGQARHLAGRPPGPLPASTMAPDG
ncbi:hypothetical protein V5E97_17460 [Singulisphaera sp. Ch08]|uniref:Uncharacterized protein n=1 Tax=Singulisphaera sp. Ch08 TaxID=3120278 RepID=A0AAU7CQM7_9BACT